MALSQAPTNLNRIPSSNLGHSVTIKPAGSEPTPKVNRNRAIDVARVIAALGVISAHIAPGDVWTERVSIVSQYCRVPFYLLIAMIFFMIGLPRVKGAQECLSKQCFRTWIPYFAWTLVYLSLIATKALISNDNRQWDWVGIFFYGQGAVHLYFITLLIWMQLIALGCYSINKGSHPLRWGLILVACGAFAWWGRSQDYLGWERIEAVPLFMLVAWYFAANPGWLNGSITSSPAPIPKPLSILAGTILITGISILTLAGVSIEVATLNLSPLIGATGLFLVLSCLRIEIKSKAGKAILSALYGIYLSHFLFIEAIEFLLERLKLFPAMYSWQQEAIFTTVVFALSLGAVLFIRMFRLPRRILLGEA
jgi:surface polysaccharide O-acyltransferase-like enzyme